MCGDIEANLRGTAHSIFHTGFQRTWHTADEDGLAGVQRHGSVQDEVGVRQAPRPDLHGLVLDSRGGHAQVQLVVVHDARLDQLLHGALVLQTPPPSVHQSQHRVHTSKPING